MYEFDWLPTTSKGGHLQWAPVDGPDIIRFTSDMALLWDPNYEPITRGYADNITALEEAFAQVWYHLMTGDMGPVTRCLGDNVPPPQPHQRPLPEAPTTLPDYVPVRSMIAGLIESNSENLSAFTQIAKGCAGTFRATDYRGGCNGARIRFHPEIDFPTNEGARDALDTLEAVKSAFPEVSYADIIVLAGQTAIEAAGGNKMAFCGGRVDADNAALSEILSPRYYSTGLLTIRDDMQVKGLSKFEGVALFAAPKDGATTVSIQYFKDLKAGNGTFSIEEEALLQGEFAAIVEAYIEDEKLFLSEFAKAWTYVMNADRFDGPFANACDGVDTPTLKEISSGGRLRARN
jgi:catalase (peroxidase I)